MLVAFTPLILLLLALYISGIILKRYVLLYKLSWIPGPPALPILGNYSDLMAAAPEDAFLNMNKYYKKYGKTYKVWIGTAPVIYCQDQKIIQMVFRQDEKTARPSMYTMVQEYLGPGLLMGEADEKWRIHRKCLSESFHTDIIEKNIKLTAHIVNLLIGKLDKIVESAKCDQPIDLIDFMKPCFFDISLSSTTGLVANSLESQESYPILDAIERMSEIVMTRLFSQLLKIKFIYNFSSLKQLETEVKKILRKFINTIVKERKSLNENNNLESDKRKIIIDAMLALQKVKEAFSFKDVEDEVLNNLVAAYDTMSTVTSFLLFTLGNNDKLQDDVLQEINEVAPNILTEGVTLKEINNMALLDRCVKETLRMYPAAPMIGRHLIKPIDTEYGTIPAGVDVYINLYNHHRDENVYPNADTFDPDRFLPENVKLRHASSWIPFGLGSRSCIGQKTAMIQTKVAIAMMLKHFSVKAFERNEDLKLSANLVIKSRDGIRVYLKTRI